MTALGNVHVLLRRLSSRIHLLLVAAVAIWYLGSTYLPRAVGMFQWPLQSDPGPGVFSWYSAKSRCSITQPRLLSASK